MHPSGKDVSGARDASIPHDQIRHPGRRLNQSETSQFLSESTAPSFWYNAKTPFAEAFEKQRVQAVHHAFLRHSWNRVDFVAVVAFWIAFALALSGQEATDNHHIYIFRALSVLRCARLLTATSGTTTILQSLKSSAFILLSVTFFTSFAMLLFGIIGIQSFEGSYRRKCVWVGALHNQPGNNNTLSQLCGGYPRHLWSNARPRSPRWFSLGHRTKRLYLSARSSVSGAVLKSTGKRPVL